MKEKIYASFPHPQIMHSSEDIEVGHGSGSSTPEERSRSGSISPWLQAFISHHNGGKQKQVGWKIH